MTGPARSSQLKALAVSLVIVLLAGCASGGLRKEKNFFARTHIENRPVTEPVRSISDFTDGLACMDTMLRERQAGTTLITSKNIPDVPGGAPVAIKQMIITALSQMSRTSGAFRYVDYEVDYASQDTVQVLTQALLASGQMNIQAPTMYVSGAVSYMDKNVLVSKRDAGMDHPDGGLGASKDLMASQIGLELHLGDFFSRSLLPGIEAANEIALGGKGAGADFGARIGKAGVDFSLYNDYSLGLGPTVRALVDLSMIELVGKWARVPYWQCVSLDQSHPEFQRQLYQWYQEMTSQERVKALQTGLHSEGYYGGEIDGLYSEAMRVALARYQFDHDAVPTGNVSFETYERLAKDYVRKDGSGRFLRIGWGGDEDAEWSSQLASSPRNGKREWGEPPLPPQIEIGVGRTPARFHVGDSIQPSLLVSRTAYLYCFYRDAAGATTQIYPNPMQLDQPVKAGAVLRIPDPNRGASFAIEMARVGQEELLCMASDEDIAPHMPEGLFSPTLEALSHIDSLDQIESLAKEALADRVGIRRIQWLVERQP